MEIQIWEKLLFVGKSVFYINFQKKPSNRQ